MSESLATVSVVLLSYNRPEFLREALASVCAQTYARLDLTVVDNPGRHSDEIARVVGAYPAAKLIRNTSNLGYAGGMNRGIEVAAGHYTLLTEDDIVLDADCVRHLVEYMDEHPATGLAAPLIYNREARTIRCAGGEMSLGGVYRRRTYGEGERDAGQYARPFDVTYIDGACLLARTSFLQTLGGFRAEFFMYVEAVELCARVAKCGRKLTVVPAAKVAHFEPPDPSPDAPELDFHRYKNTFALYLLHARARHLPEFFVRYVVLGLL
ncbi:MAG: glycosyltransferase family 2 protein, partial [Pyrinomonadaceae bacterium]